MVSAVRSPRAVTVQRNAHRERYRLQIEIRFRISSSVCSGRRVGCGGRGQMQAARLPLQRDWRSAIATRV